MRWCLVVGQICGGLYRRRTPSVGAGKNQERLERSESEIVFVASVQNCYLASNPIQARFHRWLPLRGCLDHREAARSGREFKIPIAPCQMKTANSRHWLLRNP